MSKTDIKKGDEVVVISGAEKGKRGKVVSYNRADAVSYTHLTLPTILLV